MTRDEVITLIQKMISLNQREQAAATYRLANETFPEWQLESYFLALKPTINNCTKIQLNSKISAVDKGLQALPTTSQTIVMKGQAA
jgi:hypothetical protein